MPVINIIITMELLGQVESSINFLSIINYKMILSALT